jgi:hypothetical protein
MNGHHIPGDFSIMVEGMTSNAQTLGVEQYVIDYFGGAKGALLQNAKAATRNPWFLYCGRRFMEGGFFIGKGF